MTYEVTYFDIANDRVLGQREFASVVLEDGKEFVGPNLMGRLLMELRDNGKLDYTLPEDALSFRDLAD